MKKIALLISIIISLSACGTLTQPTPFGLNRNLVEQAPQGTPGFRYGWKNGCESGMAAYGNLYYKTVYSYKYDSTALHDNEYQAAWELGFRHCRWYTSNWLM